MKISICFLIMMILLGVSPLAVLDADAGPCTRYAELCRGDSHD